MTREEKLKLDRLVAIYLNGLQSVTNDAGWEGMSLLERLIEFLGEPPPPTGNDQSNMSMIIAVRLLRRRHAEWPMIHGAMSILQRHKRDQALCLMARNYYVGICPWTNKAWTDENRAETIHQDVNTYRYNLQKGYRSLKAELERAETYKQLFDQTA